MSEQVKTKEKVVMDPKYIIKLTLTLLITCVIVAGLLGLVNQLTAPNIAAINKANTEKAMAAVVADPASTFSDPLSITDDMTAAAAQYKTTVSEIYEVQSNGAAAGYAVKVNASGSQGTIVMMVGVDSEGAVTGVSIVKNAETSGIGTRVMNNEALANSGVGVLDQFVGMSHADGDLAVGTNVDAITGATVSSKGVTSGVNGALAVVEAMG
ncbi:FMN-binding protein [Oscillibacter ruminantium]|jgi:electron transport complex protein RnfG|uniref:FMN-binding protein n=1 Tax=Oscillibacter ruminantium TaxID=1263547 RepID=UPI0002FCF6DA|nr:FMN-binding protein [Oscillibacter ruminantium]MDN0031469.1 FMN-binding protein [Oscillibacter valericigenes]MEA5041836.1 FMN-binding protein [Oscillibacter ruminantium]